MELCTLASGSSGNAVLVFDNDTALLFDAGISAKRICDGLKQLGLSAGQLDGICITGGEPTLQPELPEFLEKICDLGYAIKLDTNGTNPGMLKRLLRDGILDYVAMDIKNSPSRYAETCGGIDCLSRVQESAALLMDGTVDYEFRTTVCAPLHTPRDMEELGRWLKGARRYFLQPFAGSGALVGGGVSPPSEDEIKALRDSVLPYIPNTQIRGQ